MVILNTEHGSTGLMSDLASRVTVVRGDYQIGPSLVWMDAATAWPVFVDSRETSERRWRANLYGTRKMFRTAVELHLRCGLCGQSVLCLSPDTRGEPYRVMAADMLSGILAHLRRSHPDVVPS